MDMKQNTSLEPSHETVAFGENSTVLIWRNSQNQNYAPHWHTALEVIIPLENDYHVTVNETHFHLLPDEILIILCFYSSWRNSRLACPRNRISKYLFN